MQHGLFLNNGWNTPFFIGISMVVMFLFYYHLSKPIVEITRQEKKQMIIPVFFLVIIWYIFKTPDIITINWIISIHMLKMGLFFFILPPLVLQSMSLHSLDTITKANPFIYLLIFSILFTLYHIPQVFKFLLMFPLNHDLLLICLFILSLFIYRFIIFFNKPFTQKFILFNKMLIMPSCLWLLFSSYFFSSNNLITVHASEILCLPIEEGFNIVLNQFDQPFAAILMIFLHKIGLWLTVELKELDIYI